MTGTRLRINFRSIVVDGLSSVPDELGDAPEIDELLVSSPDIMSGSVVFRHTRVPVAVLFENLADGMTVDDILDSYPTLDRADVLTLLHQTSAALSVIKAR